MPVDQRCSVESCENELRARGLCGTHYAQWRRGRLTEGEARSLNYKRDRRICAFSGCERFYYARGLCDTHYQQLDAGIPLQPIRVRGVPRGCVVEGCSNKHDARGFCSTHYSHAVGRGEIPSNLGRLAPNKEGYVRVFAPGHPNAQKSGHVLEHVLVMSSILGRPLLPGETVHHLNSIRSDNRPENLELWISRQCKGARVVDAVAWARWLLARYGDEFPEEAAG